MGTARNRPPKAVLQVPSIVECSMPGGAEVTLDASASTDADGVIVGFQWSINGIGFADGVSPTMTVRLPLGRSRVAVTVYDAQGGTGAASAQVLVQDTTPPKIEAAEPGLCIWPPSHRHAPIHAGRLGTRGNGCV